MPKDQGVLGILDLEVMNIALLSKWLWKLFNEEGMWQQILTNKYLKKHTLCQVLVTPGDSHFWQELVEVKRYFWPCVRVIVGDGRKTSFWEDHWISDGSLAQKFPRLFSVSLDKSITVRAAMEIGVSGFRFRRVLVGILGEYWMQLQNTIHGFTLPGGTDKLSWKLTQSGSFSVKSCIVQCNTPGTCHTNSSRR